jgi:hypothetical protein
MEFRDFLQLVTHDYCLIDFVHPWLMPEYAEGAVFSRKLRDGTKALGASERSTYSF